MNRRRAAQPDSHQVVKTLRTASPAALAATLKILRNDNGAKKTRKKTRFHGSDHFLSSTEFEALCAASKPFYALLWRLMLAHGLRVSEAIGLRPQDVAGGFLCVQRLKGSEYTRQPLSVDLSSRLATGSYRIFPCPRSSAYLNFRKAAAKVGIDRSRSHPHCNRHSTI